MPPHKRESAALAVTPTGIVLLNLAAELVELNPGWLADLAKTFGGNLFIGVPLDQAEARLARARLDDAASELAARVLAARRRKARR